MRRFRVAVTWQDGSHQTWLYPHMEGEGWVSRSLTASEFLAQFQQNVSLKTTECPTSLREFLLEYFFTLQEEVENGGWATLSSITEIND